MADFVKNDFQDNTGEKARQSLRRALRQEMLARREALPDGVYHQFSQALCQHLLSILPTPEGHTIGFCWPIRQEPDVLPALRQWLERGGKAALPVVVEKDAPLAFRQWQEGSVLVPDRYGIPTPCDGDWLAPDILLLPVNAFDAAGYRLGYGGGYFDRTLASLAPRPLAIGLGFELNRVETIHPETHDQPMDWVVTEAGALRVSA